MAYMNVDTLLKTALDTRQNHSKFYLNIKSKKSILSNGNSKKSKLVLKGVTSYFNRATDNPQGLIIKKKLIKFYYIKVERSLLLLVGKNTLLTKGLFYKVAPKYVYSYSLSPPHKSNIVDINIPCHINDKERNCKPLQLSPNYETEPYFTSIFKWPCDPNDPGAIGEPKGDYYTQIQIGNGKNDCENGADEINLRAQCIKNNYLVYCEGVEDLNVKRRCVPTWHVGDGIENCINGWDEKAEVVEKICTPNVGLMICANANLNISSSTKCFQIHQLGDGIQDCPRSIKHISEHKIIYPTSYDEKIDTVKKFCNTPFRRTCGNISDADSSHLKCIPYIRIGDGYQDCYNNYDEVGSSITENCVPDTNQYYCGENGTLIYNTLLYKIQGIPNPRNRCLLLSKYGTNFRSDAYQRTVINHCLLINSSINMAPTSNTTFISENNSIINMTANTSADLYSLNTTTLRPVILGTEEIFIKNKVPIELSKDMYNGIIIAAGTISTLILSYSIFFTTRYCLNDNQERHGLARALQAFKAANTDIWAILRCKCFSTKEVETYNPVIALQNTSNNTDTALNDIERQGITDDYASSINSFTIDEDV